MSCHENYAGGFSRQLNMPKLRHMYKSLRNACVATSSAHRTHATHDVQVHRRTEGSRIALWVKEAYSWRCASCTVEAWPKVRLKLRKLNFIRRKQIESFELNKGRAISKHCLVSLCQAKNQSQQRICECKMPKLGVSKHSRVLAKGTLPLGRIAYHMCWP